MSKEFNKNKNAYLVLAHSDVAMLNILIHRLLHTGIVFVHLDKSCKINRSDVLSDPGVYVYKEINVYWGGW
jgi:hypothetical protein